MQFRFNPLRVCVRGQLLAAVVHKEKKAVVFGVGHVEFEGTKATHLFRGGVRPHLQGLSCAAAVRLLQSHAQVILNTHKQQLKGRFTKTYSWFENLIFFFVLSMNIFYRFFYTNKNISLCKKKIPYMKYVIEE